MYITVYTYSIKPKKWGNLEMDRSREERAEKVECAEEKVREKSGTKVEVDSLYDCENLRIVWKNVRKIRMTERQLGLGDRMSMYNCDICAINET